jgi:predicted acyl esterase
MFPTANVFQAGHRIRLDISSSNFPKFDVNPNTGEPDGKALRKRIARNSVYVDAGRSSLLRLPILPL